MPLHMRVPKLRGFNNPFRVEYQAINLDTINDSGLDIVDPVSLLSKSLVSKGALVKVLGRGEVTRAVTVRAHAFSKSAEAAITAALVRAPNASPAQVAQRACTVLRLLEPNSTAKATAPVSRSGAACEALDLFTTAALQRRDYAASEGIAPHVARQLVKTLAHPALLALPEAPYPATGQTAVSGMARSELRRAAPRSGIRSTLSAPLQRFAVQTLQQHLRELAGRHVEDAALVVLDNATGEVLAWVGSSGELSDSTEVDFVTALRQPGSTLKPFLYAQAISQRRITAASLLDDSGTQIQTSGGLYIPQNYDHQFKGWVSARTALAASLNVPSVRVLAMVSPDAFHRQLIALGLPLKESGDYYGYSLALGSAEVSLLNLTNAYRALANGGRTSPISVHLHAPTINATRLGAAKATALRQPTSQALDPRAAFIVSDILSDTNARARTFGTDSVLTTRFWSAVKTGTSKDMRDNWAVGYSERYTVGVWVGNASGAPMWDVSGTTGAAPIWAAMMNHLHTNRTSRPPQAPAGMVQTQVQFAPTGDTANRQPALEASRTEWFLAGTQQDHFAIDSGAAYAYSTGAAAKFGTKILGQQAGRITHPTTGTIIALDPDIPPQHQRLSLQANGSGLRWQMDGKVFAKGNAAQWLPWPGRHLIQITDASGQVLDEVRLEVRGAGVVGKR